MNDIQADNQETLSADRVLSRLNTFFPDESFDLETVKEDMAAGNIFTKPSDLLPFLQTALLDEKLIEVQFDSHSRLYFGRIADDPPPPEESTENEESSADEQHYQQGEYLSRMSHLISLPVEPGLGNLHIRYSKTIILRFFTSSYAVELGTFYNEHTKVGDLPVLKLSYPVIGRIVRGAREYRAKVPDDMGMIIQISGPGVQRTIVTEVFDICASGLSFTFDKDDFPLFTIDENCELTLMLDGEVLVEINGIIRHLSKVRKQQTIEYIGGVQLDLTTRAVAAKVESTMAMVQRAHLKALAKLSEESGHQLIA